MQRAIEAIQDEGRPIEERIHDARKRFKEARALIRLFRSALAGDFDVENRWYRDAGREISPFRDATAAVEAAESLGRDTRREIGRAAMRRLLKIVRGRRDAQYANPQELRSRLENITAQLPIGVARIHDSVPVPAEGGFELIASGLRRTFRDGRRAMDTAYASGDEAAFHEWRKRIKDHWYHVQLLTAVWPEIMQPRAKALRDLSQLIGHHHDLAVVRALIAGSPEAFGGPVEALRISDLLQRRQHELAEKARPIGSRVYADSPQQFTAQMEALWRAWRG